MGLEETEPWMPEDELKKQLFDLAVEDLPRAFVRDILRVLPLIYREAHARSFQESAWGKPEGHDLCGHIRRSLCEFQIRKLAIAAGMSAKPFRNPKKTSFYTLVRADKLVLTQSALQLESQMARPAVFREQHAAVNHILSNPILSGLDIEPPNLRDPGAVYAILFHGPQPKNQRELGFAVVGFPVAGSHRTLYRFPLDLIAKTQNGQPQSESNVEDNVRPKFRRKQETGDE
jgi:hypothetical protein